MRLYYGDEEATLAIHEDHRGQVWAALYTRRCVYYQTERRAPWWGRLALAWCKIAHGRSDKGWNLPSAGARLWFPITCYRCDCHYEVGRPFGWWGPWNRVAPSPAPSDSAGGSK